MSYADLEGHGDRERLMSIAFTLSHARGEGEHTLKCNPEFVRDQKKRAAKEEAAYKRGKAG